LIISKSHVLSLNKITPLEVNCKKNLFDINCKDVSVTGGISQQQLEFLFGINQTKAFDWFFVIVYGPDYSPKSPR